MKHIFLTASALLLTVPCFAQIAKQGPLFDAPQPALTTELRAQAAVAPAGPQSTASVSTPAPNVPRLTLAEAEKIALTHNPNISIAHLLQLASVQVTHEVRAGELPNVSGDLTAVGAHENSRITAAS
jgi:outer membrane protein TolC